MNKILKIHFVVCFIQKSRIPFEQPFILGLFKKYPTFLYKAHNKMNFENFIHSPSKYFERYFLNSPRVKLLENLSSFIF